jgi:hypothetical protein
MIYLLISLRLGLYLNYETKYNLNEITVDKARAISEKKIQEVNIYPYIPKNFLITSSEIKNFVLTLRMIILILEEGIAISHQIFQKCQNFLIFCV